MITARQLAETIIRITEVSRTIDQDRNHRSVALAMVSEVGELAEEIRIQKFPFHKKAGKDGIIGELADVVICATDFVHVVPNAPELDMTNLDPNDKDNTLFDLQYSESMVVDHGFESDEVLLEIAMAAGLSLSTRHHISDNEAMIDHVAQVASGVFNGAIYLARLADLDYDEFSEVVTDKLEKWKTNYSK
jgi:NTP pyrophosphatase (non-canonical NTP hydrolase)